MNASGNESAESGALLTPELMARLERLELATRKVLRGRIKGERRSQRKGQSVEFSDFRNYVPGDDPRFIDWNTYARLERLFLKIFLEEEDLHLYVLIDDSRSMDFGRPTKFFYAKQLAAALGFVGLTHADRVKIETINQPPRQASPAFRSRRSVWQMVRHLERLPLANTTDLATGAKNFCLRNPGQGILVLLSDFLDKGGYETALRYFVARRMDVYVVQLLSAEELDPEIAGDLRLVDCEDGDVTEITASGPLLSRYKKNVATFTRSIQEFCHRRGMNYILADGRMGVDRFITHYLRKRGLLRR